MPHRYKVRENIRKNNDQGRQRYNNNIRSQELKVGDGMLKNEDRKRFRKRYIGLYVIKEVINKDTYFLYIKILDKIVLQIKKLNPAGD